MNGHDGGQPRADSHLQIRDRAIQILLSTLIFVFEQIPIDRAVALGTMLGRVWYRLNGPRTRRVRDQLEDAFPGETADRRENWAREVFVHLGRGLAELVLLIGGHRRALLDRVHIEGLEHLEAAECETPPGGAVILTAHQGNWELACAKAAAIGIPLSVVYRERKQPALDRAMLALRGASPDEPGGAVEIDQIPMGRAGIRLVRALEAGRKVVVVLDQDARREEGVFVSFFGRLASTRYGPISLATQRGFPILPAFARRDPDGKTHRLQIQPALQLEPGLSDDEEVLRRNVQRVTAVIESEIRACPGQWIWTHRRWRTQPGAVDRNTPSG